MPVIDHTSHTLELERFKKDVLSALEDLKKRVDAIEGKKK